MGRNLYLDVANEVNSIFMLLWPCLIISLLYIISWFITVHDIFLRKQIWTAGRPVEFTHADDTLVIESGLALSWECSWDKYHLPPIPPSAVVILIINTNLMLNTIPDR